MVDQPKSGFDPQQHGGQAQQQTDPQEDKELTDYLTQEEGHTEQSAKQEIHKDREGVKQRHKKHKEKHGQR